MALLFIPVEMHGSKKERRQAMTTFDYCVLGFIPVAIALITYLFYENGWDLEQTFFEEKGDR